jgi:ABC-type phosphate/phosphonate transport system substrate-binding protein
MLSNDPCSCIRNWSLWILLLFQIPFAVADNDNSGLTLGVFPYLPTKSMEQIFAPIAARFSELTKRPVALRSRPDYARFREQVRQQTYDILFIQPFDYVSVAAPNDYIPLARWVASSDQDDHGDLNAIIVTRGDSAVKTVGDLQDQEVAVPNVDAAVSVLGRHALARLGIKVNIRAAGNHIACLQQVQVKRSAACITAWPAVMLFEKKNGVKLKLVYTTDTIPSSLFAIHTRVPEEQRRLLETELLSWRGDDPNDTAYLSNGAWTRLYPATDKDYDIVRKIWAELGHQDQ